MFSNGSQPETGFPRRYKIAADVEFITSATIISSIRIILMERIAFFLYRVGCVLERAQLSQLDCDIYMSYSSASLTVIFICLIPLFLRYEIEQRLRAVQASVHPKHPLHAYYHSIKPAGPIHPFTMSIPLALTIPCLIHSLRLVNPLFIDPIDPIDPEYPISRLRDSKFYKQRNRICTDHVAHVGILFTNQAF